MWNNIKLKPPPTNSCRGSSKSVDTVKLRKSLNNLITVIKYCKEPLQLENNLICSILYKFKTRLRNHIEIKLMVKIKKHLERYNQINLIRDINHMLSLLPSKTGDNVYLPTKQMLEYILVRIQGYSKLLSSIIDLAVVTAKYMIHRLMLGHYWTFALTALSIVSRMWEICHHIIEICCNTYDDIMPMRDKLNIHGLQWLEDDYIFPPYLRKWLDLTWTLDDLKSLNDKKLDIITYVISDDEDEDVQFLYTYKNDCIVIDDSKLNDDDVEFVNEYIDIIETPKNRKLNLFEMNDEPIDLESDNGSNESQKDSDVEIINEHPNSILDNDIGETVQRESLNTYTPAIDFHTSTPYSNIQTDKKHKKRKNNIERKIQRSVLQDIQLTPINSPTLLQKSKTTDTSISMSPNKLKITKMRKRTSELRTPTTIRNKKVRLSNDNKSVVSISDTSETSHNLGRSKRKRKNTVSDDSSTNQNISESDTTLQRTVIEIDDTICSNSKRRSRKGNSHINILESDLSQCDSEIDITQPKINLTNLKNHSLAPVTTIKDFNKFLAIEKALRLKHDPKSLTKKLNKDIWKSMMKAVEEVFVTRKQMKQDKKFAVTLAKNIVRKFIK